MAAPLGVERVFRARTRRDLRLPGEGFYDQPGNGLTPEYPDRDVRVPLAYGGEGWLTETMTAGGGLAAGAGAVARTIGHYAVWGLGLRRPNQNWARSGGMAGTSSLAISRPDESRPLLRRQHPQFRRRQSDGGNVERHQSRPRFSAEIS